MNILFMALFGVAALGVLVAAAVSVSRAWKGEEIGADHLLESAGRSAAFLALLFLVVMWPLVLVLHGWSELRVMDSLLYAVAFAISLSALRVWWSGRRGERYSSWVVGGVLVGCACLAGVVNVA
ncbi:hypothetical protein Ae406Ps2_6388c [Pseudonocardia sp. Ae406_Ps2]|nr:hypothetical protein Ae406Ps2_6388c [Pseudonocardia sp. Ae406_Ps2]